MCRLCLFAGTDPEFSRQVALSLDDDRSRLQAAKDAAPGDPSLFSNLEAPGLLQWDFACFEPLTAFPNPTSYYQPMEVDGERLGSGWSHGWARGIGFMRDGSILVYAKAAERVPFSGVERFSYYFAFKVPPSSLSITCAPPRFIVSADSLAVAGTNLLTGEPATHTFSFTFSHLATEKSTLTKQAASRSDFYRKILHDRHISLTSAAQGTSVEHYLVTTPHFAPAPLFMLSSARLGFETRFSLQNAVASFLETHLKPIANAQPEADTANL